MKDIPFKEVETVSNDSVLLLIFVVFIIAIIAYYLVRYIQAKGLGVLKKQSNTEVEVISQAALSAYSRVFIIKANGKRFLIVESTKNITMQINEESESEQPSIVSDAVVDMETRHHD